MSRKVVIVEDDEFLAQYYQRLLQRDDYATWSIGHAIGAIDVIDQVRPDVILLDVLLTGTTGFSLLHELQSHTDLARIPVVLITGMAEDLDSESLQVYGVRRVLSKTTMHPDDIRAAVKVLT